MNRRDFLTYTLATTALGLTNCFLMDKPRHFKRSFGKNWRYHDYTFKPTEIDDIKKYNEIPEIHHGYRNMNLEIRNSKGEVTISRKLVKKSISEPESIEYVRKGLDKVLRRNGTQNLGKRVVDYFHKDISKDEGHGEFSLDYEEFGDSTFTLNQFRKNGYKGDCDDFAMALMSAYEIARKIAKREKGDKWKALYEQLQHYQVISVAEKGSAGHNLCMTIEYNRDFSQGVVKPLEPQKFKLKDIHQDVIVGDGRRLYHVRRKKWGVQVIQEVRPILWYFNSTIGYYRYKYRYG